MKCRDCIDTFVTFFVHHKKKKKTEKCAFLFKKIVMKNGFTYSSHRPLVLKSTKKYQTYTVKLEVRGERVITF